MSSSNSSSSQCFLQGKGYNFTHTGDCIWGCSWFALPFITRYTYSASFHTLIAFNYQKHEAYRPKSVIRGGKKGDTRSCWLVINISYNSVTVYGRGKGCFLNLKGHFSFLMCIITYVFVCLFAFCCVFLFLSKDTHLLWKANWNCKSDKSASASFSMKATSLVLDVSPLWDACQIEPF